VLLAFATAGAVLAGIVVGSELRRLDALVRARFDGQRFQVPSRVFSAPTLLAAGVDWKQIELRDALTRLGYQEVAADAPKIEPGRYVWQGDRVRIHLRAFEHPSRPEPSRLVELRLDGREIASVRDLEADRELGGALLEPEIVGSYYGPHREQRELVRLDEVPRQVIDAILSVEDQRFEEHHGLDPIRIVGAMLANLRAGGTVQGGSTLTQQLVKNFFLTPERSLRRKLREAAISLLVEARYSKDEILECYLNEIYLAQRGGTEVHGVGEASRLYFGKPVQELDVAEAALIAAVIPGPNAISPYKNPERALARRDLVLDLMHEQGRIDDATWTFAKAEPLRLSAITPEPGEARYFLDVLRRQLPEVYANEELSKVLSKEGLRIYSTLDLRLQRAAARALRDGLDGLEKRFPKLKAEESDKRIQGCVIALRPATGEVLALVGGRDYGQSQFDRCTQARRQMGSVFKPFVYMAALEPGTRGPTITLASHLDDEPVSIATPSGPWTPVNYDKKFRGNVSVRTALENSLNVPTVRLSQEVGIDAIADLARRFGIESPLPLVPSLALGVADVAPIEVARAYAAIANGGVRPEIRTFEDAFDAQGNPVSRPEPSSERVIDAGTAFLGVSLLEGVVDRGTAASVRSAGIEGAVAGKTGTTDDGRDAWFAGFTPDLVVVVWVGFDEPRKTALTGASGALPIWTRFVLDATGGHVRGSFEPPDEVQLVAIEPATGAQALDGCPERANEWFLLGTEPTRTCPEGFGGWFGQAGDERPGSRTSPGPATRATRKIFDWLKGLF
jgi:penicillin-binding protein 1B